MKRYYNMLKTVPFLYYFFVFLALFPCDGNSSENASRSTGENSFSYEISLTAEEKGWLEQNPVVRARVGTMPPLHFFDGQYRGISVDYLNLIAEIVGFQVEYVHGIPWSKAIEDIKKHENFDILLTAKNTKERQQFMRFTDDYLLMPWVVFTRTESGFVSSINDLIGKTVAVEKSFAIQKLLMAGFPDINLLERNHSLESLQAVASGEADAYIGNLATSTYIINKHNLANLKVACPAPLGNHNQAFVVRKDWPELVSILNKAIQGIPASKLTELRNKWFNMQFEYGISTTDFLKWISLVIGICIIILLFFVRWNQRLKKEIDERKQAEEEKQKIETILKAALESMSDAVFISDAEGRFIEFNSAFATFHKLTSKEECYSSLPEWHTLLDVYRPNGQLVPLEMWAIPRALRGETGINEEYILYRKDTGVKWFGSYNFAPIRAEEGAIVGSVVVGRDISKQKLLEESLLQAQKMESVGFLAGGVAHDFNNMLNIILGYGNIMLEEIPKDDPMHECAQEIVNAGIRSSTITRQLLAFARKQAIDPQVIDLNETVEEVLKMLRRLIGEDIVLNWHPSSVWPVYIDPSQLDQILANLCVNARDAIQGVGKITIETEKSAFDDKYCSVHPGFIPGEFVLLSVSDDGIGMDSNTVRKIFDPFFTTKELDKGTGLGLAMVYGIVKQNNGFINVYSEPDQGTTLRIYLPRHTEQIATEEEKHVDVISHGQGEAILVVEDEASILKLASRMLTKLGYVVLTANSPQEAIKLIDESDVTVDLLITDVIMPEMNGRDLANVLQAQHPQLKCLFMSGYTSTVIAERGVLEEGTHFIQKPFSSRDLGLKVAEVLRNDTKTKP